MRIFYKLLTWKAWISNTIFQDKQTHLVLHNLRTFTSSDLVKRRAKLNLVNNKILWNVEINTIQS